MQSRLKREAHVSWVHKNDNKAKSDGLILWERSGTGSNGKFLYALAHVMGGTTVGEITMISGVYSNVRNFFLSFAIILWTVDNWDIIFRKKRWSQLCSIGLCPYMPVGLFYQPVALTPRANISWGDEDVTGMCPKNIPYQLPHSLYTLMMGDPYIH